MCLPAKTKSDKLRISTQFHVAFAPDFYVQTSFLLPWHETTADFPSIFKGLSITDKFPGLALEMPNRHPYDRACLGDVFILRSTSWPVASPASINSYSFLAL